ncbi:hypothetical protein BsWGS_17926 [Bradybaena similaris]
MACVCLLIAALLVTTTYAQTVAQQCLTEQFRITNSNTSPNTPEGTTMAAFDSICRNYENYVTCFQTHLPASNIPADRFLLLVFSRPDMERAYRGLCTNDLENLRRNIRCVVSTPAVRACYNTFNQGVDQIVNLQAQNRVPRETLQTLACNVTVTRYHCEIDIYSRCDARAGQTMQDFFFATLPGECRRATGVTSRYVAVFNGGNVHGEKLWSSLVNPLILTVLVFVWKM